MVAGVWRHCEAARAAQHAQERLGVPAHLGHRAAQLLVERLGGHGGHALDRLKVQQGHVRERLAHVAAQEERLGLVDVQVRRPEGAQRRVERREPRGRAGGHGDCGREAAAPALGVRRHQRAAVLLDARDESRAKEMNRGVVPKHLGAARQVHSQHVRVRAPQPAQHEHSRALGGARPQRVLIVVRYRGARHDEQHLLAGGRRPASTPAQRAQPLGQQHSEEGEVDGRHLDAFIVAGGEAHVLVAVRERLAVDGQRPPDGHAHGQLLLLPVAPAVVSRHELPQQPPARSGRVSDEALKQAIAHV